MNIPYALDTLNAYAHLTQGENKSITQYLTRAKVLLQHIYHNPKMFDISGIGYDILYLVRGLHSPHVQRSIASKQDTCRLMQDILQTIDHVTRSKQWNGVLFKLNFEIIQPVIQVNKVSFFTYVDFSFCWYI